MTKLQKEIIDLFKEQETYHLPGWGFSAMGHREVANIIGVPFTSASNAMRSLFDRGIFFDRRSKDEWDETTYFLANTDLKTVIFNEYREACLLDLPKNS